MIIGYDVFVIDLLMIQNESAMFHADLRLIVLLSGHDLN